MTEPHHGPSPLYYFQWLILLSILILGLFYALRLKRKGKPKHENLRLAFLFTLLVFTYYGLNYLPAIKEYHEPAFSSLIKFFLLIASGSLTVLYGILGRHNEHEPDHSNEENIEHKD